MAHLPVSIQQLAGKSKLSELKANSRFVFWLDAAQNDEGRQFLNCYYESGHHELCFTITSSSSFNIKSRINEYGGGSYWLNDNCLYFYNSDNQCVYAIKIFDIVDCYKLNASDSKSVELIESVTSSTSRSISNLPIRKLSSTKPKSEEYSITYADGVVTDNGFIAVREIVTGNTTVQQLIYCDANADTITILDQDYDFYSFPRLNPSKNKVVWVSWNHPSMPWDENFLCIVDFDKKTGQISNKQILIHDISCSNYQPEWYNDDNIFIVSDRVMEAVNSDSVYNLRGRLLEQVAKDKVKVTTGTNAELEKLFDNKKPYWNLYLFNLTTKRYTNVISGEFELGLPLWQLATNTYTFSEPSRIYMNAIKHKQSAGFERSALSSLTISFYAIKNGKFRIGTLDMIISSDMEISEKEFELHANEYVYVQDNIAYQNNNLYFLANTKQHDLACVKYNLASAQSYRINNISRKISESSIQSKSIQRPDLSKVPGMFFHKLAGDEAVCFSEAQDIVFTNNLGLESYAFFYKPQYRNPNLSVDQKPPLIVMCHGGPTGTTNVGLNYKIQFWTSRGYAVVDVNYSGSTSYGKNYRDRLKHNWGIIDVADCASAAEYLIQKNLVDAHKIFIRGTSAGGLVVITALYKYSVFTAGVACYPVSDLTAFADETHNFEKFYNHYLIGDPKITSEEYVKRSPISFADKITKPILLMHGTDDRVIPIEHSQKLYKLLEHNNPLNKYIEFPGEGHGFRTTDSLTSSIQAELEFYNNFA